MFLKVSVPGSLMLFGEHAVLQNKHAISAAINKRLYLTLTPRSDDTVIIRSSLGDHFTTLKSITPKEPFTFVLEAIKQQKKRLPSGFEIQIDSEMSPLFGLGTSAAVTVATTSALMLLYDGNFDPHTLFKESVHTVRSVQGRGSGADVAASIFGGTILYQMDPLHIEPLKELFDLTVIYSGSKMKTALVIDYVLQAQRRHPKLFTHFFTLMDKITLEAKDAILKRDLKALGELFNLYQGTLDSLGVNNQALSEIVYSLRASDKILGSKISGSGLGDCAIGLGNASDIQTSYPVLSVAMSQDGVKIE